MRPSILLLYATVSGNAEQLAEAAAVSLRARGHEVQILNVAEVTLERLRAARVALCIVSTWGEGVAPPDAENFFEELSAVTEPTSLQALRYAVLALGSSMYVQFCAAGRRLDAELERAGARRLIERVDCDTKFKADFERWLAAVHAALEKAS